MQYYYSEQSYQQKRFLKQFENCFFVFVLKISLSREKTLWMQKIHVSTDI